MGRVVKMGILLPDMRWRNSNFLKVDKKGGTKWRYLYWRRNKKSTLQYKWLPNGLPMGAMDSMGIMHKNMWWGNSGRHKESKKGSKRRRKLSRLTN